MDSPGGLQAAKKVSFSYSFGFLLQTKEFKQIENEHLRYHIFTKNENSS